MPNSRRRKFSVQNAVEVRNASNSQNGSHTSSHTPKSEQETKITKYSSTTINSLPQDSSNSTASLNNKIVSPDINKSVPKPIHLKTVATSSTDISIFISPKTKDEIYLQLRGSTSVEATSIKIKDQEMTTNKDETKREKHPRQHRAKIRSTKRRVTLGDKSNEVSAKSVGINAVESKESDCQEQQSYTTEQIISETATAEGAENASNHSSEYMCRICHGCDTSSTEVGELISACTCRGTVGRVHVKCLERWLTESGKSRCELCGTKYTTRRVHRYGVPKALLMWILSQNTKQLMVDSLGIMLMSPLAVLAAWLSGRTLAGLMNQDNRITPWPLASTFVLACMTLVCYYCWIVSAATRHALGWWIWYRSQYEVRLQLHEGEE